MVYYDHGEGFEKWHSYCLLKSNWTVYNNYGTFQNIKQGHNKPYGPKNRSLLLLLWIIFIVCIDKYFLKIIILTK